MLSRKLQPRWARTTGSSPALLQDNFYALMAYDAVYGSGLALTAMIKNGDRLDNGTAFTAAFRALSFEGASGTVAFNKTTGDRHGNFGVWNHPWVKPVDSRHHESRGRGPRAGFILAETLVQNGTTGNNGTAGGTLNHPVLGFWYDETSAGRHFVR